MYPDFLFPKILSDSNVDSSQLDLLDTPTIVARRNEYSWEKSDISLGHWEKKLHEFNDCYEALKNPDLPRVRRQLAKKNSIQISKNLRPLIEAGMHARWLEVESAVCQCVYDSDILCATLITRGLLEEADRCQLIARDIKTLQAKTLKYSPTVQAIMDRLYFWALPKLKPRTKKEIETPVPRKNYGPMDDRLENCMVAINDYVHPNYGSHVVLLRPLESQAIETIKEGLTIAYTIFFEINWLCGIAGHKHKKIVQPDEIDSEVILDTLLKILASARKLIPSNLKSFYFGYLITRLRNEKDFQQGIDPHALNIHSSRDVISRLEKEVDQLINNQSGSTHVAHAAIRLFNAQNSLKMQFLRDKCLENIVNNNVIAAATFARAFVEHYAIEIWVLEKSTSSMDSFISTANNKYIDDIEKKLARCLVGSKNSLEHYNIQKEYWDAVYGQQRINLMACIKISGEMFESSYDYLSGVIHGLVITGGDLLGGDQATNGLKIQAYFYSADALGQVCGMEKNKAAKIVGLDYKLDHMMKASESEITQQKIANSLKVPEMFKHGRDYYGDGSKKFPFYFRPGLQYYKVAGKLLEQLKFGAVHLREVESIDGQTIVDKYTSEHTVSLYFQTVVTTPLLGA